MLFLSRVGRMLVLAVLGAPLLACAPEPTQPVGADAGSGNIAVGEPISAASASKASPPLSTMRGRAARYDLEGICEVKPRALVQIKSQANGEVTAVRVDVGDAVRKGQLLIEISPRALNEQMQRNQLSRERVSMRMALLDLQIATQKHEAAVLEPLYSEAGNTAKALSIRERETELASAKIELQELELSQRGLERELRYTQIQSPSAGIVVKRTVEPGQVVNAAGGSFGGGDGLLELADPSELQLDCAVHAEDADLINQRVPMVIVLSRTSGLTAPITVTRVSPMIDSKGQVPQVRFTARFASGAPTGVSLGARYPLNRSKDPK